MFVPDGENSFRVSLCYFYEHLANLYPLLSFDFSIFIFPSFRVLYFDGFILIDHIFESPVSKVIRTFIRKCNANVDVALEFSRPRGHVIVIMAAIKFRELTHELFMK